VLPHSGLPLVPAKSVDAKTDSKDSECEHAKQDNLDDRRPGSDSDKGAEYEAGDDD